jgi:hypothetical protein
MECWNESLDIRIKNAPVKLSTGAFINIFLCFTKNIEKSIHFTLSY